MEAVALLLQVEAIETREGLEYDRAGTASYLADIYERLGEIEEARRQLQTSRSILERLASQEGAAGARWRLVDLEWQQRDFELRRTLAQDDLARLKEATDLTSPIFELWRAGRYREALPAVQRALEDERSIYGPEHPAVAKRLHELGLLHRKSGDYYAARDAWTEALDLRRRVLGREHPLYGESLFNLGEISELMGRFEEAQDLIREARVVLEATRPVGHPDRVQVTLGLENLQRKMGDPLLAEATLQEALEEAQVSGEFYHDVLSALANVKHDLGLWEEANAFMEELENKVTRKEVGDNHVSYSDVLLNRAVLFSDMGEYAMAEDYFERAAQILAGAAEPVKLASLRSNWALLRHRMGDLGEALRLLDEALEVFEGALPRNHPERALILMNLAGVMDSLGETQQAEMFLVEALTIIEDRLGVGNHLHTTILNNLGAHYQQMNDLPRARDLLARAAEQTPHESYLGIHIRINLAVIDLATGSFDAAARQDLESALRSLAEITNPNHPDYCYALTNLATAQVAMAKPTEAAATFRRSLDCLRDSLELAATVQSERQQLAMLVKARQVLDSLLSVSGRLFLTPEELYASVLQWKGIVLSRRLRLGRVKQDSELAGLVRQLQAVSSRLAALAHAPDTKKTEEWRGNLTNLSRSREDLQRSVARQSDAYRKQESLRNVQPRQVLDALPPDAALIDLVEYWDSSPSGPRWRDLLAFVLRPGRPIKRVDLGPSQAIQALVTEWRIVYRLSKADRGVTELSGAGPPPQIDKGLGTIHGSSEESRGAELVPGLEPPVVPNQSGIDIGLELRRRLWEPLADAVGDARLILLSPDGPTTLFPLGALPSEDSHGFLLEEKVFVWTPAAQILVLRETTSDDSLGAQSGDSSPPGLLTVGAVDFDRRPNPESAAVSPSPEDESRGTYGPWSSRAPRGGQSYSDLPASGDEAEAVAKIFYDTHPTGLATSLKGRQASEGTFRRLVVGQRFVHLATHGFFAPALRAAWFPSEPDMAPSRSVLPPADLAGWDPGLLSGIVFAGANRPPDAGSEDGILTAVELETLDLSATEMVVLSACETGLGISVSGEGLLGLLRAAQAAGARSVVASLWSVPDRPTSILMERFYENLWGKKMSRAEALRSAQLEVLRIDRDPAAWAGWILVGEWR